MSDAFLKYVANNFFIKLTQIETYRLIDYFLNKCNKFDIKIDLSKIELLRSLPLILLKLIENDKVGIKQGFLLLIQGFNEIDRADLAKGLEEYDKESKKIQIHDQMVNLNFEPYKFQVKLATNGCMNLNNIICVRTGSGKTLIAGLIAKYWLEKFRNLNKLEEFKVVFVVPTRNLVVQQANAFLKLFNNEDLIQINEKLELNLKSNGKIYFITPQKLINSLNSNKVNLKDISILILDECHHTNENHPYNELMRIYYKQIEFKKTLIIGLTASLGVGKSGNALDHLIKLCVNMDCKLVSSLSEKEDLEDLSKNIPSPLEDKIEVVRNGNNVKELFKEIEYYCGEILQKARMIRCESKLGLPEFENFLADFGAHAELQKNRDRIIAIKYLVEFNLFYSRVEDFPVEYCLKKINKFLDSVKVDLPTEMEVFCGKLMNSLINYIEANLNQLNFNPKLNKLIENILNFHKDNSRGLILVRTRNHTKALSEYLNRNENLKLKNIKSDILTGLRNVDEISMNENQQKSVIENFLKGNFNLLVATDIAQEGLDVPCCNYIIRYEFVSNEIGTVQSRGRARASKGQAVLITTEGSLNHKRELENRLKEKEMENAILELNSLDKKKFDEEYTKNRNKIIKENQNLQSILIDTSNRNLIESSLVQVHCRDCSKLLFNAKHLRYREPSFYCVCKEFAMYQIELDEPNQKFYCSDKSCKKLLGRLVPMRKSSPLYMIDISGIKFQMPSKRIQIFKQWMDVYEKIEILKY